MMMMMMRTQTLRTRTNPVFLSEVLLFLCVGWEQPCAAAFKNRLLLERQQQPPSIQQPHGLVRPSQLSAVNLIS